MAKRFTFSVNDELEEELETLADHFNSSQADVIRRALALLDYYESVEEEGGKLIVEEEDGSRREIAFIK